MVSVDFGTFFLAALMLLVLPLNWLSAAFFAALFHEVCHIAVVFLFGGKILGITIGVGGAKIETAPMEERKALLCALAGPVGSFLLIAMCRIFPRLAVCAVVQGLFNMLPIYPLDGGRILSCMLRMLCPGYAERISGLIEILALLVIILFVFVVSVKYSLGILLPIFAMVLILSRFRRKIPCKQARIGVQ